MNKIVHGNSSFLIYRAGSGHTVEIFDIVVGGERRQGTGRRMVNELLDFYLPKGTLLVWAITRSTNFISQMFYEELRFRVVGVLRDFYRDEQQGCVDAIMYGRDVVPEEVKEWK